MIMIRLRNRQRQKLGNTKNLELNDEVFFQNAFFTAKLQWNIIKMWNEVDRMKAIQDAHFYC